MSIPALEKLAFFPAHIFHPQAVLISWLWTGLVVVFCKVCRAEFHSRSFGFLGEFGGGVLEVCAFLADHAGILPS